MSRLPPSNRFKPTSGNGPRGGPFLSPLTPDERLRLLHELHRVLVENIDLSHISNMTQGQLRQEIQQAIEQLLNNWNVSLPEAERRLFIEETLSEILGFGPLESLLNDPNIAGIWIQGATSVFCRRRGAWEATTVRFRDNNHLSQIIDRMFARVGKRVDETSPAVQARWEDGTEIQAVISPLTPDGPTVMIRRPLGPCYSLQTLHDQGTLTTEMLDFLSAAVRERRNVVVSGLRGSGRTTVLNVLAGFIPAEQRVAVLETCLELRMMQPGAIRLNPRGPNICGVGVVTLADLIPIALKLAPDRLILDECNGPEARGLLDAILAGYGGSLLTLAASSPHATWRRWEQLVLLSGSDFPRYALREALLATAPILVQTVQRGPGEFRVSHICELTSADQEGFHHREVFRS